MKRIAVVVGHGPVKDRGAVNDASGMTELDWNRELAVYIYEAIGPRAQVFVLSRRVEGTPPTDLVNTTDADCAVELHLNAYNGSASGTEMIHHPSSTRGKELAVLLQQAAVGVLGLPDRGVKGPQAGGRGMAFLSRTRMPAVIVESFFIDNDRDLAIGTKQKKRLAAAYAEALLKFVNA